jgi:uncharacterized cupin superfamily protein
MDEQRAYRSSTYPPEEEFQAFVGAEGGEAGVVAWLRTTGAEGKTLKAGMWRCEKSEFPYLFGVDETFVMVEGVLRVAVEDGPTWDLGPGETASFLKGTRSTWTVVEPCLHFFIQSD